MKKQAYMKPTMQVVNIRTQNQLLAGSLSSGSTDVFDVKGGDAGSGDNLSRQGGFWDDDEDF